MGRKKTVYRPTYGEKMIAYFSDPDATEVPSFVKFADAIGVTYATLLLWRKTCPEFRAVYAECKARLVDRLIDGVLQKKYDATFVKAILSGGLLPDTDPERDECGSDSGGEPFRLTIQVVGAEEEGCFDHR